jgi:hypothetical protein
MPRVSWSVQASSDLENIEPGTRDQIRRSVEEFLHDIPPLTRPADEGAAGGIMWHRCIAHEHDPEHAEGPQNYFIFYRKRNPALGFEVLAIRSIQQIADLWEHMRRRDI